MAIDTDEVSVRATVAILLTLISFLALGTLDSEVSFGLAVGCAGKAQFSISIRLHWEGYDSALALGFTGPKS